MRVSSFDFDASSQINDQNIKKLEGMEKNTSIEGKDAEKVAKEFETMYVEMMLKSMRDTAKPEDESNSEGIYKNMLDGEYAKIMSDSQSFGIRDMVSKWMNEQSNTTK